jgi:hypothetical protein
MRRNWLQRGVQQPQLGLVTAFFNLVIDAIAEVV